MAKVLYTKEATFTEEILKMTNATDLFVSKEKTEKHMTESGRTMRKMVLEFTNGQMGVTTREITVKIKDMEEE